MTTLHNDGQDREMRRCSAPLAIADPDVAVLKDARIFARLCQQHLDRAQAVRLDAAAEAIDALLAELEQAFDRFATAAAVELEADGRDCTVSGIAGEQRAAAWRQR